MPGARVHAEDRAAVSGGTHGWVAESSQTTLRPPVVVVRAGQVGIEGREVVRPGVVRLVGAIPIALVHGGSQPARTPERGTGVDGAFTPAVAVIGDLLQERRHTSDGIGIRGERNA